MSLHMIGLILVLVVIFLVIVWLHIPIYRHEGHVYNVLGLDGRVIGQVTACSLEEAELEAAAKYGGHCEVKDRPFVVPKRWEQ